MAGAQAIASASKTTLASEEHSAGKGVGAAAADHRVESNSAKGQSFSAALDQHKAIGAAKSAQGPAPSLRLADAAQAGSAPNTPRPDPGPEGPHADTTPRSQADVWQTDVARADVDRLNQAYWNKNSGNRVVEWVTGQAARENEALAAATGQAARDVNSQLEAVAPGERQTVAAALKASVAQMGGDGAAAYRSLVDDPAKGVADVGVEILHDAADSGRYRRRSYRVSAASPPVESMVRDYVGSGDPDGRGARLAALTNAAASPGWWAAYVYGSDDDYARYKFAGLVSDVTGS